jgi:hypothetical protein
MHEKNFGSEVGKDFKSLEDNSNDSVSISTAGGAAKELKEDSLWFVGSIKT